ncbi:uncharacterized protein LOC144635541 [Oculina patagonica]
MDILHLPRECSDRSVGDEMHRHFKILHQLLYISIKRFAQLSVLGFNLIMYSQCVKMNHQVSRIRRAGCVLWSLVCILLTLLAGAVLGAICLICFFVLSVTLIVMLSPLVSLVIIVPAMVVLNVMPHCGNACVPLKVVILSAFSIVSLSASFLYNFVMIYLSCTFVTSVVGFIIVGFVLNADIVTPYAAFLLVVATNIYLCYANLQNRYKEVKKMILKWEKELHINSRNPEDTISSKLFWFVFDKVLPIKTEFCLMFRNVVLILSFLFLVVFSIVSFGNQYNVSAIFSTIAVVVSGVIPALVLKGLTKENIFIGWEKIKMKREIETAVREFYQDRNSRDMEGSQLQRITNNDTPV